MTKSPQEEIAVKPGIAHTVPPAPENIPAKKIDGTESEDEIDDADEAIEAEVDSILNPQDDLEHD